MATLIMFMLLKFTLIWGAFIKNRKSKMNVNNNLNQHSTLWNSIVAIIIIYIPQKFIMKLASIINQLKIIKWHNIALQNL